MEGLRQLRGVWTQAWRWYSCWPLHLPFRSRRGGGAAGGSSSSGSGSGVGTGRGRLPPHAQPPGGSSPAHFTDDEQLLPPHPHPHAGQACACHPRSLPAWCFPAAGHRFLHGIACDPLLTTRLAIMGMLAILLVVMTILTWYFTSTHAQRSVSAVAASLRHELLTHAGQATKTVIQDNNASTVSVARLLNFTSDYSVFSTLDTQVSSTLYTVYSALPRKRTLSFYGRNGMFVSYTSDVNGSMLLYSNTSYILPNHASPTWGPEENITVSRPWYRAFRQPLDSETGLPAGDPAVIPAIPFWGTTSFNVSLYARQGASSWSFVLEQEGDLTFQTLSPVRQGSNADAVGVAAVGVSMGEIRDLLDHLDLQGGDMFLMDQDCRLIAQTRDPLAIGVTALGDPVLPLASASNNSVVAGAARYLDSKIGNCTMLTTRDVQGGNAVIGGTRYLIDYSKLAELTLICVIVIPHKSIWGSSDKRSNATLAVLIALAVCAGLVGCFFVILLTKGVSNEMRLRAALIKQLEATKEAETKSSQKSIVFASMSHDLRTPLAAIIGLIDICLCDAAESTELEGNLLQMKSCAENLLGILNSVLDMSKIEAGKLQLVDKEFDLVQVLEEVVDMFAVVGMKKGLEVVLDLPDDSMDRVSRVRGDEGRVKQLFSNLLSNGVKFTNEGHVVLRAWPKPSSSASAVHTFRHIEGVLGSLVHPFRKWLHGKRKSYNQMRAMYERYVASSKLEFEFEVDDTGKGIPRDQRKAVFDNFVQVDTSTTQANGGTGLGLGIVRSLVRLMGGDIAIIDKGEPGEPGTCFRFNLVFSRVSAPIDLEGMPGLKRYQGNETRVRDRASVQETFGSSGRAAIPMWSFSSARRMAAGILNDPCSTPPLAEGVNVLLAMQGVAGKRVVKRWMERRGLQVWSVNIWEDFLPSLEKIRHEIFYDECFSGFSERFEIASPGIQSYDSWAEDMEARRRGRDWIPNMEPGFSQQNPDYEAGRPALARSVDRTGARLLIVIDADMVLEPLSTLAAALQGGLTRDEQHSLSRVVWLVTANTPSHIVQTLKEGNVIPCALCLHKPLHGSRLNSIWELVQDLVSRQDPKPNDTGGIPARGAQVVDHRGQVLDPAEASSLNVIELASTVVNRVVDDTVLMTGGEAAVLETPESQTFQAVAAGSFESLRALPGKPLGQGHTHPQGSLSESPLVTKIQSQVTESETLVSKNRARESEMMGPPDALAGKLILVAEDNPVLQKLTRTVLLRMGATVECVDDGAEAVRRVVNHLPRPGRSHHEVVDMEIRQSSGLEDEETSGRPYDMVFMDCQMPVLDGYEATTRIREEEKYVGWRTPVIALTAHAMAQDERKCMDAGMDFYLTKPLSTKALLDVISKVNLWKRSGGE